MMPRICIFVLAECQDGWFGEDCNSMCGHCNGTEVCDKESGYCSACAQGYMGALCIEGAVDTSRVGMS